MRLADYTPNSTVDGVGVRQVFWLQGCPHHCPGCHNPQTWDESGGKVVDNHGIIQMALESPFNVTFSGGDPLYQIKDITIVCKALKEAGKNIWVYTGYMWEQVMNLPLMDYIDVLVDGRFKQDMIEPKYPFRGSSNQRIIDVQRSLNEGGCVWYNCSNALEKSL